MTETGASRRGLAQVATAAFLLGTIGTAAELGPESLSANTAAVWRTTLGAAVLVAVATWRDTAPWRYPLRRPLLAIGACAVAVNQLGFFAAVDRTGVAIGTTVVLGSVPAAAGIVDVVVHHARPTVRWSAGVGVAVAGVAVLTGAGDDVVWSGVGFAVLAGAAVPVFGLAAQDLMADRPPLPAMATVFAAGALLVSPAALASATEAFASPASAMTVLYLGIATLAAAYAFWGAGLRAVGLSTVAAVGLLEPPVAATLAVLVLDEALTVPLVVGVALVIAGVALASIPRAAESTGTR